VKKTDFSNDVYSSILLISSKYEVSEFEVIFDSYILSTGMKLK
jgi:hypothetical protein